MPETTIKTEILIHDLKVPISVIDAGAKSLLNRQDSYGPLTEKQIKVLKRIIRNPGGLIPIKGVTGSICEPIESKIRVGVGQCCRQSVHRLQYE